MIKKIWYAIKRLFVKVYHDVKALGWFWGSLAVLIATIIFYSPSIATFILYLITGKGAYLAFTIGYAVWWFSPAFSPALIVYFTILAVVIKIFNKMIARDMA